MTDYVDIETAFEENLRLIPTWSHEDWAAWFLRVTSTADPAPLLLIGDTDVAPQVRHLFKRSSERARETMRRGVVSALATWEGTYNLAVFKELCWLAALLRASDAAAYIAEYVIRTRRLLAGIEQGIFEVFDDVVAALAGFAPNPRVQLAMEALLFESSTHWRYASTLMLGACACDPLKFDRYLNRYVVLREREPDYFEDAVIVKRFFDWVPPSLLGDRFADLTDAAQAYIVEWGLATNRLSNTLLFGLQIAENDPAAVPSLPLRDDRQFEQLHARYEAFRRHSEDDMAQLYATP